MAVIVVIALISLIACIVKTFYDNIQYWKRHGIPGPTPSLFFGNLPSILSFDLPYPILFKEWAEKYGKIYGYYDGWRRVLVISDLEMIQEFLVKKFDDFHGRNLTVIWGDPDNDADMSVFLTHGLRWKRLRALAAPSFGTGNLKKIHPIVQDSAKHLVKHFEKHLDGDAVNARCFCQELTLDVISRLTMGQEKSMMFRNLFKAQINAVFSDKFSEDYLLILAQIVPALGPLCKRIGAWKAERYPGSVPAADIYGQIASAVQQRKVDRANGVVRSRSDMIDIFLDAVTDAPAVNDYADEFRRATTPAERVLTEEEIVAQCYVLLTAGYDTPSNALSYAMFHLAKDERVRTKMRMEIDEICTEEEIDFNTINNLKYMDCVIKEALRMYPVAAFANNRQCMRDSTLGDLKIEKAVFVAANPWTIHYDKKIWGEDADEFRPERWEDEDHKRHQMSWIPFGAGPRQCLGMRLAYLEEKLALAYLFRKFDLVAGPKTPEKLELRGCMTTFPVEVPVYVRKRPDIVEQNNNSFRQSTIYRDF